MPNCLTKMLFIHLLKSLSMANLVTTVSCFTLHTHTWTVSVPFLGTWADGACTSQVEGERADRANEVLEASEGKEPEEGAAIF